MRRHYVLLLLVLVACVMAAAPASARAAQGSCGSALSLNATVGAQLTGVNQYGVQADLTTGKPAICGTASTSPSFAAAWVMETGSANCDGYAQVGYMNAGGFSGYNQQWAFFTQWYWGSGASACGTNGAPQTQFWGTPSGTNTFKVGYNTSANRLEMWINGTLKDWTNPTYLNPNNWRTPWQGQFMGETHHCASDVPGVASNPVKFTNISKRTLSGTWSAAPAADMHLWPDPVCSSSRYHSGWLTSPSFQIWTNPLS